MFHQVVTLEADVQEPRAAAVEMSADLARLGLDNGALQQDMGRKRQRLGGQEQAPAMGRALYQEYLRCLRLAGPPDGRAADPTLTTSVDRADRAATSQWVQHYPQVLESFLADPDTGVRHSTRERYILARSPVGAALLLGVRGGSS